MTSVSRLSRANIRPLFLPAPGTPPSVLKHAYDIAGIIVTVTCTNFVCTPFMLLTLRDSLEAWRALDWYGLWIIFGGLAFFYAGGGKALKSFHPTDTAKKRQVQIPGVTPLNGIVTNDAGTTTPMTPGFVAPFNVVAKGVEKRLE